MPETIRAAILSLGTEITNGIINDTHGKFLSAELSAMGIRVERICQMRDDPENIPVVRELVSNHELVIVTGGLGPTSDDMTREAIAEAAGVSLRFDEELWGLLTRRYRLSVAEANRKQAFVPEGFHVVSNPLGTAPGLWGRIEDCLLCAMPGPPRELEPMFVRSIRDVIAEQLHLSILEEIEASSFLIPEAMLEDACQRSADGVVSWRTRFQPYRISLYIGGGEREQQESFLRSLQEYFGYGLIQPGDIEPARIAFDALREKGWRLSTAESCTGGLIGSLLTEIPGVSPYYWGGFVTYDNQAKERELGVKRTTLESYGAVSGETALEMAVGTLQRSETDIAVSVTGVAGPEGGTADKPVGTVWIAVACSDGLKMAWRFEFGSRRNAVRRRSAVAALLLVDLAVREPNRLDTVKHWHYS